MKRMPNIKLTREEFERLLKHKKIGSGSEATIYQSEQENTAYKIFGFNQKTAKMSDNKANKIFKLYQMAPEHITSPISTISLDGTLIGYEMLYDPEDKQLNYK